MTHNKIIALMGPTGTGKTERAIQLSESFPLEIVSVDSALVYREMNIGTAKPSAELLKKIPHHLINIISPEKNYSVAQFLKDAKAAIQDIQSRGKIPFLVGGTMLYFKALIEGLADIPEVPKIIREKIAQRCETKGLPACYAQLESVDPSTAKRLHPHDAQRILRALEVFEATGKPLSAWIQEEQQGLRDQNILQLILMPKDRAMLHEALAKRFHQMLQEDFIEEVKTLQKKYHLHADLSSMRSVGYRQVWEYLHGEIDENAMIEKAIAASRQLAKRQMTWLRAWKNAHIVFAYQPDTITELQKYIAHCLCNKSLS